MRWLGARRGLAYDPRMGTGPVFNGDTLEAFALTLAVERTCKNLDNVASEGEHCTANFRCAAHKMLLEQRTIDRLVFYRRMARELLAEEYLLPPPPHHGLGQAA